MGKGEVAPALLPEPFAEGYGHRKRAQLINSETPSSQPVVSLHPFPAMLALVKGGPL